MVLGTVLAVKRPANSEMNHERRLQMSLTEIQDGHTECPVVANLEEPVYGERWLEAHEELWKRKRNIQKINR